MTEAVRTALSVAVAARAPVLLWGGPGVGKTSAVREMAAASDLPCETVIASIREPSDFAGLPVVAADGRDVSFAPPRWAQRLADAGRGVLFLDEISTAPPSVQAALLRVVLERTVGDLSLPDDVTIVAAANPPDQAADGWDLSAPLANRFCHLDWTLEPAEWANGVLGGFTTPVVPKIDVETLRRSTTALRVSMGAFVTGRPAHFHAVPADEQSAGRAFPTPRSWDMAARLLAAATVCEASEKVAALLAAGAVGPAAAAEFLAWREELDLPDPESVLRDPKGFKLPDRGDRAYAALASVTAAVLDDNTPARWEAAWLAIAAGTRKRHADIGIAAVRTLIGNRPDGARPPREVLQSMAPVLRAAGLFDRLTS
jgi:hypothetical protein